jgi:hypothetical protein
MAEAESCEAVDSIMSYGYSDCDEVVSFSVARARNSSYPAAHR